MIVCFELTMPNRGSWNGRWSQEKDRHIITKTDRQISKKKCQELDGQSFYYRWSDRILWIRLDGRQYHPQRKDRLSTILIGKRRKSCVNLVTE